MPTPGEMGHVEVTPYEPPPPNPYADLTDDQVEAMLSGQTPAEPEAVVPDETPAPTDPVAVPETIPEPTPTPEPETVEPDNPVEARLADLERTLELERLERQKAAAELERTKFIASRNAGEAGYLKKMLAEREKVSSGDGYAEPSPVPEDHPAIQDLRKELGALKTERVGQALAEVAAQFKAAHPDSDQYQSEMQAILAQSRDEDVQAALYSDDPKLARITAKSMLESAYAQARIQRLQKQSEEAKARSAEQAARLRASKATAAPPGVQKSQPEARTPAAKSLDQMTDAELDALLDARIRRGG